jgi:hypothetical protein
MRSQQLTVTSIRRLVHERNDAIEAAKKVDFNSRSARDKALNSISSDLATEESIIAIYDEFEPKMAKFKALTFRLKTTTSSYTLDEVIGSYEYYNKIIVELGETGHELFNVSSYEREHLEILLIGATLAGGK